MRGQSLVCGAAVAIVLGLPAAAGAEGVFPRTSVAFQGPAEQLWTGQAEAPRCTRPAPRQIALTPSPTRRLPMPELRGELIAEFAGKGPVPPAALAQARSCAATAEAATTAPVMLASAQGFSKFQTAFAQCMDKAQAGRAVGSMTLWVDAHCNW
ncbi:hypothetical protein [Phenylobacterium sp.]|jgi:hypothetical protein|uniref:hypothetical protein n=1 Tax=Phenylobacterium sp. TaxID=1871053 RepID=UPI002F92B877